MCGSWRNLPCISTSHSSGVSFISTSICFIVPSFFFFPDMLLSHYLICFRFPYFLSFFVSRLFIPVASLTLARVLFLQFLIYFFPCVLLFHYFLFAFFFFLFFLPNLSTSHSSGVSYISTRIFFYSSFIRSYLSMRTFISLFFRDLFLPFYSSLCFNLSF